MSAPAETFWHIIRNGKLVQGMFARLSNAKRTAKRMFPDGNYQIIPAPGRAALRSMGYIVDR